MSAPSSTSSTPFNTPSRSHTTTRPPRSPVPSAIPLSPTPSNANTILSPLSKSATQQHSITLNTKSIPTNFAQGSQISVPGNANGSGGVGGWNDLPQNLASTPNSLPRTPSGRGRARDLLRKHYGLGVGIPPPSGKPLDPMNIDSPAFDAKSYYEQLITTSSLSTLLKRENELLSEIRQLDSERQSLVYNHHHELIAASDTISAMKTRAESIDADLDKLRVAFSEISRLNEELNTASEQR